MPLDHAEELFLEVLAALRRRLADGSRYELLVGAGEVRKLLLDNTRLVDTVNREMRMRIRFTCPPTSDPNEGPFAAAVFQFFSCMPFEGLRLVEFTRDQFLKRPFLALSGRAYAVHDLLLSSVVSEGGVHHSVEPPPGHAELRDMRRWLSFDGKDVHTKMLTEVIFVVVAALEPLEAALVEKSRS